jgi:hypothetical protein
MTLRRTQSRTETTHLGHLKLYRDDLIEIAKALAEVGTLAIECGDWVMDDSMDFENPDLPERLPDVAMTGTDGKTAVSVKLGEGEASVHLIEPTTFTEGTLSRILRLTKPRRRIFSRIKFDTKTGPRMVVFTTRMALLATRMVPFPVSVTGVLSSAVLINAYRDERPTFWQRTRDDWIVAVVMLLLGAMLGGVIGYWVNTIT